MGDSEIEDEDADIEDGGADTEDEDAEIEADRGYPPKTCRWGVDGLETVRCQSSLSPEGLFRTVGRISSRLLYPFVRFSAL